MTPRCTQCGCELERAKRRKFCSGDCFHAWSRGRINKGPKPPAVRLKIAESQRGRKHVSPAFLSPERGRKISVARIGMKFSEAHRKAMSDARVRFLEAGGFGGRQSNYVSNKTGERNWAHSSWERELMCVLDERSDIVSWTKNHGVRVSYDWRGQRRTYVPDFYVVDNEGIVTLLEAKGYEYEPDRCALKYAAAEALCKERGWQWKVAYQVPKKGLTWNVKVP